MRNCFLSPDCFMSFDSVLHTYCTFCVAFNTLLTLLRHTEDPVTQLFPIQHFFPPGYIMRSSVAVAWSAESLPSNPAGSEISISVLGLGVCPLSVFCPVLSSAEALTLCWPHIQGGLTLCICLVQRLLLPLQASGPRAFGL